MSKVGNTKENTPNTQLDAVGMLFLTQTDVSKEGFLRSLNPRSILQEASVEPALLSHQSDLSII